MNSLRKPDIRAWIPSRSSPLREGSQIEPQEGSISTVFQDGLISGKMARNSIALFGRGNKPVPGTTGEYHSDNPACAYQGSEYVIRKWSYHARYKLAETTVPRRVWKFEGNDLLHGTVAPKRQDNESRPLTVWGAEDCSRLFVLWERFQVQCQLYGLGLWCNMSEISSVENWLSHLSVCC